MPKKMFDIDLLDTSTHNIIARGVGKGRSSTEALRFFAKTKLLASQVVRLNEKRAGTSYDRFQFLYKERK